ncbi:MAG: polyprenyl synthetase family protein, partial [Acetivibrio ethanolgignens]
KRLRQYRMFGRYLGMIFQLTDDCIDFEMDEGTAKKNVQSDYEQGVITLPLIHAFQESRQLKEKAALGTMTREEMNEVVEKTGGLSFTRAISKRYFDKAVKQLEALFLSEKKKALLMEILEKAYYGLKKKA